VRVPPRRSRAAGRTPDVPDWAASERSNHRPTVWVSQDGAQYAAVCLACPDLPCARLAESEVTADLGIETSHTPNAEACPTSAVQQSDDGLASIDGDLCIQCGVCVTRCPVGAIWTDEPGQPPMLSERSDVPIQPEVTDFAVARERLSRSLPYAACPIEPGTMIAQCEAVLYGVRRSADPGALIRALVRNALQAAGVPVQLKNMGDNSAPCEVLARTPSALLAIEIQPSRDEISGVRRLLAAAARLESRYGMARDELVPLLVLESLPNSRAGLYELLEDVESRLGLHVRVLTVAMLVAMVNNPSADVDSAIKTGWRVSRTDNTLPRDFAELTGIEGGIAPLIGIAPAK
jgi:Fe-S-cluster-containing hydrogenase component 2